MIRRSLLVLCAGLLASPAGAQDAVHLTRLDAPIRLDGRVDDDEWAGVEALPMTTYQPVFGAEPTEATEIRVGYDDDFLYLSARMFDSNASEIRGNTLYRDKYSGDDTFGLVLDTFDDNENALWFFTTPNGVRVDMAVAKDGESSGGRDGNGEMNTSWNTYWDVFTSRDEAGWYAEMRIPYSSLGFIDRDGRVTMGLSTYRYIARKNERHVYPASDPALRRGFAKPSQAQTVVLEGVKSRRPIYITPYLAGGAGGSNTLNLAGTAYSQETTYPREAGLDIKQSLGSNLTLDLTFNTDFAQAEADDQQVNLTRFSLFFPEKRQFFQERAGIFDFSTGRSDRLFHTRAIGLSDYGPVRILGGGRLVGRIGSWDIGVINMQTGRENFEVDGVTESVPTENFGVLRLRRRVLNEYSYAGGIFTSRIGENGQYGLAYGLDSVLRIYGTDYLTLQFAQTFDQDGEFDFVNSAVARIRIERRTQEGLNYRGGLSFSGADYDPGVGFSTRSDYYNPFLSVAWGWFPGEASRIRRISPSSFAEAYFRRSDNEMESMSWWNSASLEFKSGHMLTARLQYQLDDLLEPIGFPEDTEVPAGRYEFMTLSLNASLPSGARVRGRTEAGFGRFYDGTRLEFSLSPSFSPSKHLELEATYEYNKVDFADRNQSFDVHVARVRAQVGINTRVSLNGFVQINSSADVVSTNARFRYNFREGNDLWLVYNAGMNLDRRREVPFLPAFGGRTILLKYTYTFIR
ncbi:MAG: hypothetical protein ACI80V_001037 [Rhodothermales bacterium]|jgi:hypothetical protein